jgi:hypothetical protein
MNHIIHIKVLDTLPGGARIGCGATPSPQSIAPGQNSRQLQLRLPSRLTFCPSCCPGTFQRPSPSGGHFPLGFLNYCPLCGHPLCNPGTNVGESRSRHLPLGFLCGFSFWRCPFDLCPSCDLSCSHSGLTGCTDLASLGGFNRLGRSGNFTAQDLTEFFLQRLDLFLKVGCFTELGWCCVK